MAINFLSRLGLTSQHPMEILGTQPLCTTSTPWVLMNTFQLFGQWGRSSRIMTRKCLLSYQDQFLRAKPNLLDCLPLLSRVTSETPSNFHKLSFYIDNNNSGRRLTPIPGTVAKVGSSSNVQHFSKVQGSISLKAPQIRRFVLGQNC